MILVTSLITLALPMSEIDHPSLNLIILHGHFHYSFIFDSSVVLMARSKYVRPAIPNFETFPGESLLYGRLDLEVYFDETS